MSIDSQALAATSQASRGMSTVYEAVAEALLNIPSSTVIATLSPGITISVPSGNSIVPVTSVVRKKNCGR